MKYAPLKSFLNRQTATEVPMTFAEIEKTIGQRLPASAAKYPAWWSNNPSNNVMTKAWLEAGFRTERVDLGSRRLVFRRSGPGGRPRSDDSSAKARKSSFQSVHGALRGMITVAPGVDLTQPTGEQWESDRTP